VEYSHLPSKRGHATFPEPPYGEQRCPRDQRSEQNGRLDDPAAFQGGHRGRAGNQDLKIVVIGRQRAVLTGDACDLDPVTGPKSAEMRSSIAAGARKEDTEILGLFSD